MYSYLFKHYTMVQAYRNLHYPSLILTVQKFENITIIIPKSLANCRQRGYVK